MSGYTFSDCTKCDKRYKAEPDTTECRPCRGWSVCSRCDTKKANNQFAPYSRQGRNYLHTICYDCHRRTKRDGNLQAGRISPTSRNAPVARFESAADAVKAYRLDSRLERVLQKARKAPVPWAVLEAASLSFLEHIRLCECIIEIWRIEAERESKAA